jgi:hypothetical protein
MRPMMRLVLGLCALVLILAGVGLALPSQVTVARSVVINAPEPVVFPYLNNPHTFSGWSPWAQRDPKLQVTYSGPDQGKGARIDWTSAERSVGAGSMEIAESQPNRHIDLVVSVNGLEGPSSYDVAPSGSGSKVVWSFSYDTGANPLRRWKGLMLDRFVGTEFQTGLAELKERIESERRPAAPGTAVPMGTPPTTGQPAPASTNGSPAAAAPGAPAGPAQAAQPQAAPQPSTAPVQEQRRPRRP